MENIENFALHR